MLVCGHKEWSSGHGSLKLHLQDMNLTRWQVASLPQTPTLLYQLHPVHLMLCRKKLLIWSSFCNIIVKYLQTSLVGHTSVLRNAATCWFLAPELSSAKRSFPVAVPTVWNSLPAHMRSTLISRRQFRDGLISHLFAGAYF